MILYARISSTMVKWMAIHEDDHYEASVETLYDVGEKDGSVERQRPRQTRKGNVSIAQTLLWLPIASPVLIC